VYYYSTHRKRAFEYLETGLGKTSDQIMAAVMGAAGCGKSFFGEAVNLLI